MLNFYLKRKAQAEDTQQPQTEQSNDTITNAQKAAFAIANKLSEPLEKKGIDKTALWDYIKQKYKVESRNNMTEMQWTQLAAELKAAENNQTLFDELVKRISNLKQ